MKVLYNEPKTWRELELLVSEVLNAAGYHASNGLQISTVRGNVNIDVLAEDKKTIPKSTYLIECKYWDSDIPQTIIHAFRTVVNDYGAHHGLIIAKNGFQSGAYAAVKNSNIQLLSWADFLDLFEERWLDETIEKLNNVRQPLSIYTDPMDVSDYIPMLSQEEFLEYKKLVVKYTGYAIYSHIFLYRYEKSYQISKKEHIDSVINKAILSLFDSSQINCYNDFFKLLEDKCLEGIAEFDRLFKKTDIDLYIEKFIF